MKTTLGILAAVAVLGLAACGDQTATEPPMPPPTLAGSPSGGPGTTTGPAGAVLVLSGTAARGEPGPAVPLDSAGAIESFAGQFRGDLGQQIVDAVAGLDPGPGETPYAAVVSIGCDIPPSVGLDLSDGVRFLPAKVASPMQECFAAVTSVALALAPTGAATGS